MLAIALLILGMCLIYLFRHRYGATFCGLIPVLWILVPIIEILNAHGINPGGVGHLAGALVGAIFLFPILRAEAATDRTAWLIGVIDRIRHASRRVAVIVRENWNHRILPAGVLPATGCRNLDIHSIPIGTANMAQVAVTTFYIL